MILDPFQLKLAYLLTELQSGFTEELALVQIWTPTQTPFTGVPESKMDTQVMQTSHHPTLVGDPTFQELRTKSCKQGITGQALGMLGKVWCSGVLQVVQDVSIVPHGVHPRNKLEHLKRVPGVAGLLDLLAEIVYIPIYDETDPDSGVIAVLEVLLAAGGRESLLANVISGVGNVLAELQLSLSAPDPDAETPEPGSMPPILIPSDSLDGGHAAAEPASPCGVGTTPFADAPTGSFAGTADGPSAPGSMGTAGSWGGRAGLPPPHSPPAVSPRQSSLRSYGTPPHPLVYGSPPTAPIRYGFLEASARVPRPGSPPPCAASNVMAAMCDFAGLTLVPPPAAAPPGVCGWAAVAAREGARPLGAAATGPGPAASHLPHRTCPAARPIPAPRQSQLTRTLSRTATTHMLDALDHDAIPLPCPFSKPAYAKACGGKGFAAQRQGVTVGL